MTQPINPLGKRPRTSVKQADRMQEDKDFRKSQKDYEQRGYYPAAAEKEAQTDFDLAKTLKKRRGFQGLLPPTDF